MVRGLNLGALGLGLVLVAGPAWSAPARCTVPPDEFAALEQSKSALKAQADVDALPAERQQMLCSTRALLRKVHAGGDRLPKTWPDDEAGYSPTFLSPEELRAFNKLEDDWMDAQMAADQARAVADHARAAADHSRAAGSKAKQH